MIETDVAMQLRKTYQGITQIMQAKIDEYGLTFGLLHLIVLIDKNPDASQKELAKKMRFTQGAMSSSVKRLIKLNMLEQVSLESDMRYNRLVVTDKGKSMLADYKDHLIKKFEDIFNGFNQDELAQLHDFLIKINENSDKISGQNNLKNLEE